MIVANPIPFEQEFPDVAEWLVKLCNNNDKYRFAVGMTRRGIPLHIETLADPCGRNDLCPCGSGKKFKRCCLGK
jgi:uncharacterized protein YecA (UPF0149 family)